MVRNRLRFSVYSEMFLVDLDMVLYFQADDHYTHVYYANGNRFMVPFGLSKVESMISENSDCGDHFVRLGRTYMVNLERVFQVNVVKCVVLLFDDQGVNYTLHLPKQALRKLMELINEKA